MPNERQAGLTLIELVITMAVAGILLAISAAGMSTLIKNNRLTAAANDLAGSLSLARTQAINLSTFVTACKSAGGSSCTADGTWDQGWIVFVDSNDDHVLDTGEKKLRVRGKRNGTVTISGNSHVADYVTYASSGLSQDGTITVCDDRSGNFGRAIIINIVGRIRVENSVSCP